MATQGRLSDIFWQVMEFVEMSGMLRDIEHQIAVNDSADTDTTFSISVDLKVKDIVALWMEALHVGLGQHASKVADITRVIDVIGPQLAPSIADCVTMLLDASRFPGCKVTRVDLVEGAAAVLNAPFSMPYAAYA